MAGLLIQVWQESNEGAGIMVVFLTYIQRLSSSPHVFGNQEKEIYGRFVPFFLLKISRECIG